MPSLTDNTAKWGVRKLTKFQENSGIPVGFEYFSTNPNIPAGSIPLFGGEYSREVYSDLWSWVQEQAGYLIEESAWQEKSAANEGNVPFYSKGDGSTTFRVPALKCWVKSGSSISEVGSYLEAQYPRIEHYHAFGYNNSGQNSGRFIATNETKTYNLPNNVGFRDWNGSGGGGDYSSDADSAANANMVTSLSVEVQGNSDTVQPSSIVGLWLVKAYGTVTNVGSTDVANISTGLTQAETRISALENHGAGATVVESYRNGTKWYRVWSDGWVEQSGSATFEGKSGTTITFFHPFRDTNFYMSMSDYGGGSSDVFYNHISIRNKAATKCEIYAGCGESISINWYACGQGA